MTELTGLSPVVPNGSTWFSQMAILPVPPCDPSALHNRLLDEFGIEIPATSWGGQRFLRLSVQGYNTHSDIQLLTEALERVLPEVAC